MPLSSDVRALAAAVTLHLCPDQLDLGKSQWCPASLGLLGRGLRWWLGLAAR